MVDNGANPFIKDCQGNCFHDIFGLSSLNNLPRTKSVFFPVKKFSTDSLKQPWCYTTGIYDGQYDKIVGTGKHSIVVKGLFEGQPSAFKFEEMSEISVDFSLRFLADYIPFVKIDSGYGNGYKEEKEDLSRELKEMTEMITTIGDSIISLDAHYR